MSDKYNYREFKKIIYDFIGDILITFPEYCELLNKDLILIFENGNNKNKDNNDNVEYTSNYNATIDTSNVDCENTNKDNKIDESDGDTKELQESVQNIFDYCYNLFPERFFDILYQNEDIFKNDEINTLFLPNIEFKKLWSENITDRTRENIWKYLQLILFSIITNVDNKNTFGDTAKLFEAINEDEFKEKLEETIKGLENIFDLSNLEQEFDMCNDISNNIFADVDKDNSTDNNTANNRFGNMPNPNEIHDHINNIMNGKLGELAKELAEETAKDFDLTEENIKDPKDIFKTLFKNPQKLMNLVKNVGSKLDQKMKSGDIKESELLEEASNMFNNIKNVPGINNPNMKDLFNNFNIGDMMKNMGMVPPGGKFNQNAFNSKMEENLKSSKMKERMRTKLEANNKKQQEDNKASNTSSNDSDNKNMKNSIQKNLDFLFSSDGGSDLTKINNDLQRLVEEMKEKNNNSSNATQNTNKKKKKGKKA